MNIAYVTGKREQDTYVKYLSGNVNARIVHTNQHYTQQSVSVDENGHIIPKKINPAFDTIFFAGLLRGNAHIFTGLSISKTNFYYVDHAYFNSGYKYPNWMRVTKNGFVQNCILPTVDKDRLKQFKLKLEKYNFKNKKNIVLFPPSNTVSRVFKQEDWETKTLEKLKLYTDRPIVVRRKSGPVMDKFMIYSPSKEKYDYSDTLDQVLQDAYCVITFNSSVALTALEKGIPVICDRFCAAYPLSNSIENIEKLEEKERLDLFASLAYGQFTLDEIKQKRTLDYINSITQWEGNII